MTVYIFLKVRPEVIGRAPISVGACAYVAMSFSRILNTYIMRHFAGSTAACKLPSRGRSEWRKLFGHRRQGACSQIP